MMMGIAQNGVIVRSGEPLAIQGMIPAGIAIQGQTVWAATSVPLPVPWQLLNIINSTYPSTTTPAMDTSGANLLVAMLAGSSAFVLGITDSLSNIWTPATGNGTGCAYSSIWYCTNPVTGISHVFTGTGLSYGGAIVAAFKCVGTPLFSNQSNAATQSGQTSIPLPPITVNKGDLVATCIANCGGNILSIDSSFNIDINIGRTAAVAFASATLISNSLQSVSPTWSGDFSLFPTNTSLAATLASFTPVPPSWQLLKTASMLAPTTTTAPIDTTGAGLIVVQVVSLYQGTVGLIDSAGNTWTRTTVVPQPTTALETSLFYCINPTTSTSHTFSVNSGLYHAVYVSAFQTPGAVSFDQIVTNITVGTQLALPALTPSAANSLVITGLGTNYTPVAITQGFSITGSNGQVGGQYLGGAAAYLIQSAISPLTPQWAVVAGANPYMAATMISFIPSP